MHQVILNPGQFQNMSGWLRKELFLRHSNGFSTIQEPWKRIYTHTHTNTHTQSHMITHSPSVLRNWNWGNALRLCYLGVSFKCQEINVLWHQRQTFLTHRKEGREFGLNKYYSGVTAASAARPQYPAPSPSCGFPPWSNKIHRTVKAQIQRSCPSSRVATEYTIARVEWNTPKEKVHIGTYNYS